MADEKKDRPVKAVKSQETTPIAAGRTDGPAYTTKCIYFPDKNQLLKLEELLKPYPRTNVSTLIAQVLPAMVEAIEAAPKGERRIRFECTLWV